MKTKIFPILTVVIFSGITLWAVSPDQTNLGILIAENKVNIRFINICLSNQAPPQPQDEVQKDATGKETKIPAKKNLDHLFFTEFLKANQRDYNGNLWYMQSNYKLAFQELRGAQEKLKEIYQWSMERYIDQSRVLLEASAPIIIRSNDAIAKHLLKLGFRDLKNAEDFFTIGYNSSPHQFRYKIVNFSEGIKTARRARRFALLAMIASKTPDEDKLEFKQQTLDDIKKTVTEENLKDYERIKLNLINYIENKFLDRKVQSPQDPKASPIDILEVHDDNYGVITMNRINLLEEANQAIKNDDMKKRIEVPDRPDVIKPEPFSK